MKRSRMTLLATLVALFVGQSVQATGAPAESSDRTVTLRVGTNHEAIFDLAIDSAGAGLAVGAAGEMFESKDSGGTWTALDSNTRLSLFGSASSADKQIVVGQQGLVLTRVAGGAWTKEKAVTPQRLLAVDMNSNGTAAAVGAFGTILRSTDFGHNWTSLKFDWASLSAEGIEPHLYVVRVSESGDITVAGEVGTILRLPAKSETWQVLHKGDAEKHVDDSSIFGMTFDSAGNGYAVGQEGMILKSSDSGATWSRLESGTTEILLNVVTTPKYLAVATIYGLRESTDGGATWKAIDAPAVTSGWLSGVASTADMGGVIVAGAGGRIVRVKM